MRRSTMIVTTILVIGFGSLMMAAGWMARPFQKDAEAGKEIKLRLHNLEWLAPDSKVVFWTVPGKGQRLAQDKSRGYWISLSPHADVFARKGGLSSLTDRVLATVDEKPPHGRDAASWVEMNFKQGDEVVLRHLIRRSEQGDWLPPDPPLPATWQEGDPAPASAPAPVRGRPLPPGGGS